MESAENNQADKYAVLDSVAADGGNLRQVLAGLDIVTDVVPIGPNITFFRADSGAGLLRGGILDSRIREFRENLPRICRGEWTDKVAQKDIMSDRVVIVTRTIPANEMKDYFPTSDAHGSKEASCGDAFKYSGTAQSAVVSHKIGQPFVWKNTDIAEPKSKDDLPPDGIVSRSWFKPKERYPSYLETIAWANRICELQGGRLRAAYWKSEYVNGQWQRRQVVQETLDQMLGEFPDDYYLHCDAGAESFLIRRYVAKEKSAIFTNTFDVQKMVVQRNRDLKSVGF
jgi:hypothetical protein